ncbi:conserved protein, unknown function [Hepatocystis sp. ex Piliocolobus tephrosceles]|nr:conserved protein, unknown function [Hepatocystis sp. ex Piliocolobus tephrosceles]
MKIRKHAKYEKRNSKEKEKYTKKHHKHEHGHKYIENDDNKRHVSNKLIHKNNGKDELNKILKKEKKEEKKKKEEKEKKKKIEEKEKRKKKEEKEKRKKKEEKEKRKKKKEKEKRKKKEKKEENVYYNNVDDNDHMSNLITIGNKNHNNNIKKNSDNSQNLFYSKNKNILEDKLPYNYINEQKDKYVKDVFEKAYALTLSSNISCNTFLFGDNNENIKLTKTSDKLNYSKRKKECSEKSKRKEYECYSCKAINWFYNVQCYKCKKLRKT